MTTTITLAAAIANIALMLWAVHRTLKNQHGLDAFASKLRWMIISWGVVSSSWHYVFLKLDFSVPMSHL
jgi:hypothetical protein